MHCYVGEGRMRYFVDDMGPDDDYKIGGIDIPSFTTRPDEMNTVAECLEIATAEHDEHHEGYVRKRIPAATAAQWAMELVEQADFTRRWRKGQSVYGPTGFTQRDTDRIK